MAFVLRSAGLAVENMRVNYSILRRYGLLLLPTIASATNFAVAADGSVQSRDFGTSASGGQQASSKQFDSKALPLAFVSESAYLPHPEKKVTKSGRKGEDALFGSKYACAVADGVGGWSEVGVDSGAYSEALLNATKECIDDHLADATPPRPRNVCDYAHANTKEKGSSTLCLVIAGRDGKIGVSNIGDSGVQVWRHHKPRTLAASHQLRLDEAAKLWELVWESPHTTQGFNFPMQLAATKQDSNRVSDGIHKEVPVQSGDLLVLGSDGLWDNLHREDIQKILARFDYAPAEKLARMKRVRYLEAVQIERRLAASDAASDASSTSASSNASDSASSGAPTPTAPSFTPLERHKILGVDAEVYTDLQVKEKEKEVRGQLAAMANLLTVNAIRVGQDPNAQSPFAVAAKQAGKHWPGGKLDDTAVVVAMVVADEDHFSVFGDAQLSK